jgi:hypothetical protein
MKAYCGEYWKYVPEKRFPWKRLAMIVLILGLTTAATPAMVAYYWNGQNSTATLPVEEALRLVQDREANVSMRKSAVFKVFNATLKAIEALQTARTIEDEVSENAGIYLNKLRISLRN